MKKAAFIVGSSLALLAGCGSNNAVSLNGDWTAKQAYFHGKPDNDTDCQGEYDLVTFTDDSVILDDTQYSLKKEDEKDHVNLTLTDAFNKVKKYTVKKLDNGNILMNEVDLSTGCELEKK